MNTHLVCRKQCSKTCGEGSRYRKVVCVDADKGNEVHGIHCDLSKRPADRESCSLQPCEYVWITGEWSEVRPRASVTTFRSATARAGMGDTCTHLPVCLPGLEPAVSKVGGRQRWSLVLPTSVIHFGALLDDKAGGWSQGLQVPTMPVGV